MAKTKVIAFYLPQFYPTPENDEWWEPGFTEWTNVAKAKPLFKGHYQPRIPQELSFYDLRVPEVRERQAELAREAGVDGFCYWHYWFGDGKRLLAEVFEEVVKSKKPDFPFCLCWANHSWYQKTWQFDKPDKLLMEQTYPGKDDYIAHFNAMLPAFKDARYMRTEEGKLIFGVFAPYDTEELTEFMEVWNKLAKENDLIGFEFFAFVQGPKQLAEFMQKGIKYDRIVYDALKDTFRKLRLTRKIKKILRKISGLPYRVADYNDYVEAACLKYEQNPDLTPCIDPMFDHSPRSGKMGQILHKNDPKKWGELCRKVRELVEKKDSKDRYIFIKAWNEWGEGNYMEPDRKFGRAYIKESGKAFR